MGFALNPARMNGMDYTRIIKEIGRGREGARDLSFADAKALYGAILDGQVPDLESGAIAIALRVKGESEIELLGFLAAIDSRLPDFSDCRMAFGRGSNIRPVVIPTYNGARKGGNLTPLIALLLRALGVPVLLHGLVADYGRVTSAEILREFGVFPADSSAVAMAELDQQGVAFVTTEALLPGLAAQLALRARLGLRNCAHSLVKMIDPFAGRGVVLASATHPVYIESMRDILLQRPGRALLFRATEGEPYVNPKRCPRIEYLHEGECVSLFELEGDSLRSLPDLPLDISVAETVRWMRAVLAKEIPLPKPLENQLACCLLASGMCSDLSSARALLATCIQVV